MDKVLNILVPVYLLLSTKSPIIVVNIFIDGVKYILYFENRLSDLWKTTWYFNKFSSD